MARCFNALFAVTIMGCAMGSGDAVDPSTDAFDIALYFESEPSAEVALQVEEAARRWEEVIEAGLPDRGGIPESCGPTDGGFVDDLAVEIRIREMDDLGGTLAVAGPTCIRRVAGFLPVTGRLTLDADDVDRLYESGALRSVLLHELGHVLGIGTGWRDLGLLDAPTCTEECVSGGDVRYRGEAARRAWRALGGEGDVPVENRLGPGSQDSHWREASPLRGELMSPILSTANPLSPVTVGALTDLGYAASGGEEMIRLSALNALDPHALDAGAGVAVGHDQLDEPPLVLP